MKHSLLILFIFCSAFSKAQNPLVKMWDYRYGGDNYDIITCFQQTSDDGFIIGGYSGSGISGDKTQDTIGKGDYWIVKLNASGLIQWDKDFGGTNNDVLFLVEQTTDGGYILGGFSYSDSSGDKTQHVWGAVGTDRDYWIVKIDSLGNKQWDKDYGGTGGDELYSMQQTTDGGYILGGHSYSGVNGNKTQPTWGAADYWIVKIDSLGNKEWDKDFGGVNADFFCCLQQTKDEGYILGGYSFSGVSGDKTQPLWGIYDYWIVKIDSSGNKQWDKDFGGTGYDYLYSMKQTSDKGYILGGKSNSGISGNKTQNSWGGFDYWILKTDSLGNKLWDKDFGGTGEEDDFGNVVQTFDEGFLITGASYSDAGGDKNENNLGMEQAWVVKTDSVGTLTWEKTIFTAGHDEFGISLQSRDGCFVTAVPTGSGIGGYKTQPFRGNYDYWIVKFCDSTLFLPTANTSGLQSICPGTCTSFLNLSTNATNYLWSFPGATPDTSTASNPTNICYQNSGNYDVQLIAINANGNDTLLISNCITVYPTPAAQAINQSGDTLFANTGALNYQWYYNTNIINGATDYFHVAQSSGDYNVVATDANGCEVEAVIFNVLASAQFDVSSRSAGMMFEVYPNPVVDKLKVVSRYSNGYKKVSIKVYDMIGEAVPIWNQLSKPWTELDVLGIPPGLYFLEISADDNIFRTKFVKN